MNHFWQVAVGVAGLGAIGSFVLWSLYRGWLQLGIFTALSQKQTYSLMVFFLVLTFLALLAILGTYIVSQKPNGRADNNSVAKLIGEYDFRLNEIETRDEEIRKVTNDDDKGALQVYIWRAVRGNSDFQPSLPEFANTHMAGIIAQLEQAGFTEHAKAAIQAARDLENGSAEAHAHQSPHGYGVFTQDYLDSRTKDLRAYSDYVHRTVGS